MSMLWPASAGDIAAAPAADGDAATLRRVTPTFLDAHNAQGQSLDEYQLQLAETIAWKYDMPLHVNILKNMIRQAYMDVVAPVLLVVDDMPFDAAHKIRFLGAAAAMIRQMVRESLQPDGLRHEDPVVERFLKQVKEETLARIANMSRGLESYVRSIEDHIQRCEANRVRKWALVAIVEHLLLPYDPEVQPMLPDPRDEEDSTVAPSSDRDPLSETCSVQTLSRTSSCNTLAEEPAAEPKVQAIVFDGLVCKLRQVIIKDTSGMPSPPSSWSWTPSWPSLPLSPPPGEGGQAESVSVQHGFTEEPEISEEDRLYDDVVNLGEFIQVLESEEKAKKNTAAPWSASSGSSSWSC